MMTTFNNNNNNNNTRISLYETLRDVQLIN